MLSQRVDQPGHPEQFAPYTLFEDSYAGSRLLDDLGSGNLTLFAMPNMESGVAERLQPRMGLIHGIKSAQGRQMVDALLPRLPLPPPAAPPLLCRPLPTDHCCAGWLQCQANDGIGENAFNIAAGDPRGSS